MQQSETLQNIVNQLTEWRGARRRADRSGPTSTATRPADDPLGRMLTPDAYGTACDLAGTALLRRIPGAVSILQVTDDKV